MSRDSRLLRIGLAVALPCVTLIAAHALFDPLYRTNDDPGMLLLSSGHVYVDEPTPYLIFSNHLWGALLAALYSWIPGAPWYRLLQLAVQFLAGVTLLYIGLGRRVSMERLIPVAGCFVVFDLLMLVRPHFTLTSAIAAIAAVILLWDGLGKEAKPGRGRWLLFALLWLLAAVVRHESALLIYGLFLPPALVAGIRMRRDKGALHALRRIGLPLALTGILLAALHGYNRLRYDVPEWRDFMESGSSIGAVVDFAAEGLPKSQTWATYPDGTVHLVDTLYAPEVYAAAFDGPRWSRAEFHMLMEWFFADKELFSVERVNRFLDEVGGTSADEPNWLANLRRDPRLPLILATILLPFAFRGMQRSDWATTAVAFIGALAALTYIDLQLNRLVSWVYEPVFALLAWIAVTTGHPRRAAASERVRFAARVGLVATLLGLLVVAGLGLRSEQDVTTREREAFNDAVRRMNPSADTLYVSWGSTFPIELIGPLDDLAPYRDLRFYSVGADTRGGHNVNRLEKLGIADIHQAIYLDPQLLVIGEPRHVKVLSDFVRERYATDITADRIEAYSAQLRPLFDVYRFRTVETVE